MHAGTSQLAVTTSQGVVWAVLLLEHGRKRSTQSIMWPTAVRPSGGQLKTSPAKWIVNGVALACCPVND